jgi:hypothetical protein
MLMSFTLSRRIPNDVAGQDLAISGQSLHELRLQMELPYVCEMDCPVAFGT